MRNIILSVFLYLLLWSCSPGGVAGTGTNAGNGKVTATVTYPDGSLASGVELYLREATYLRDTTTVDTKRKADTVTNCSGTFAYDSLSDGMYQLEIHNRCKFAKVILFEIENGNTLSWDDTLELDEVSALDGEIATDDIPENVPVYVQIQGMEYVQRISTDGYYRFRGLPAGEHKLTFVSGSKETGTIANYAVVTEASKSTVVDEVSFPVSLVNDTLYVREILDQNGLQDKSVSDFITIAKGRVFAVKLDSLGLSTIPRGMGRMRARHLSLVGNELDEVPFGVSRNKALITLDMNYNKIQKVPGFVASIPHLKVLKLAHNDIDSISDGLTNVTTLENLDLSFNKIAKLPNNVGYLSALNSLNLQENELITLPKGIVNLTSLSYLNLNSNRLEVVVEPLKQWIDANSTDPDWKEKQKQ